MISSLDEFFQVFFRTNSTIVDSIIKKALEQAEVKLANPYINWRKDDKQLVFGSNRGALNEFEIVKRISERQDLKNKDY